MTARERIKQLLDAGIIQAWAQGKTLQYKNSSDIHERWEDYPETVPACVRFEESHLDWRIKPEPREFWVYYDKQTAFDNPTVNLSPISTHLANPKRECLHLKEVFE